MSVRTRIAKAEQAANALQDVALIVYTKLDGTYHAGDGETDHVFKTEGELQQHIDATRPTIIVRLGECAWPPA